MPLVEYSYEDEGPMRSLRPGETVVGGTRCVYRLFNLSMRIDGMPDEVTVGPIECIRVAGPVQGRRVHIHQRMPPPTFFDKHAELLPDIGAGRILTVAQRRSTFAPDLDPASQVDAWRAEARAAIGLIAAALDERVATEEAFEDVLLLGDAGQPIEALDKVDFVRSFRARPPLQPSSSELNNLIELSSFEIEGQPAISSAARWYLKGARLGPTAEAVVFLWTAVEALAGDKPNAVSAVESLMDRAGLALPTDGSVASVGRLFGLRSEVVHRGVEGHGLLEEGFCILESIARGLIRHCAGIPEWEHWPVQQADPALPPEVAEFIGDQDKMESAFHPEGLPRDPQ